MGNPLERCNPRCSRTNRGIVRPPPTVADPGGGGGGGGVSLGFKDPLAPTSYEL